MLARTQSEIDEQLNEAVEVIDNGGSRWPAMTYEDGVESALLWVTGRSTTPPMED